MPSSRRRPDADGVAPMDWAKSSMRRTGSKPSGLAMTALKRLADPMVSGYPLNLMTPRWTRSRVMYLDTPSSTLTANRFVRSRDHGASVLPRGSILMLALLVTRGMILRVFSAICSHGAIDPLGAILQRALPPSNPTRPGRQGFFGPDRRTPKEGARCGLHGGDGAEGDQQRPGRVDSARVGPTAVRLDRLVIGASLGSR